MSHYLKPPYQPSAIIGQRTAIRQLLHIAQWILKVNLALREETASPKKRIGCSVCKEIMQVVGIRRVRIKPG